MSRRSLTVLAAVVVAVVVAVAAVLLAGDRSKACMRLLVPAYFAPGTPDGWDELLATTPRGVATVIMNPASGPGPQSDPRYTRIAAAARAADIEVVGYVHTRFGTRPAAEVEADVESYQRWYDVDGIFMDEASSASEDLPYYRALASEIHAGGDAKVILNPGRVPDEAYMEVADVVVTFEGTSGAYAAARFPDWTGDYGAERFAHLIYGAGAAGPGTIERSAAGRHAANVYVTDDLGANPWDRLAASYPRASDGLAGCGVAVT